MIEPIILFRAVHIAATVLACGTVAFLMLVAEPAARTADNVSIDGLRGRLNVVVWWALAAAVLGQGCWLIWLSADIYGAPILAVCLHGGVWTVLTDTRFGLVSVIRLGLAALLAVLVLRPATRLLQLAVGAGLIALLALIGHAGATPGIAGDIHLGSDAIHLLAAGGWLGALPALALVLANACADPAWRGFAVAATRRFSWLGAVCVGALLVTGVVNAWNLLSGPRDLVTTDYGRLLFLKIGLFVAMLGIAVANRFHFTPRLPAAGAMRALQRNCLAETGLGLCVLVCVGVLGTLSPSGHAHPTNADVPPNAAFVHIHTAEVIAEVSLEPGHTGEANARIRVLREDFSEYPAKSVKLTLDPPDGGRISRAAAHLPDGTWVINAIALAEAGVWTVRVVIPLENGSQLVLDSPVVIDK